MLLGSCCFKRAQCSMQCILGQLSITVQCTPAHSPTATAWHLLIADMATGLPGLPHMASSAGGSSTWRQHSCHVV
jgi:hypothetical protein